MREMTTDEAYAFLTAGTRTGKLAWTSKDGGPHVAPIWFVVDGADIVFNTHETSGKGRALRRDPRVSLVVDLEEPPYAFVKVDGEVQLSAEPDELRDVATRIGGRYMGADRAEEFGLRNGVEGELVCRIVMTKMTAIDGVSE